MTQHNKAFGKILRVLRKQKQYTQETLAFESGLDRTYVSLLELGRRSPTLDTMMALCEPLGVSLSALCAYIEEEMINEHG
ncbi:MAG: helix-turn-helix transcriptional regulator [Gallionellaceae bacterium]|jgi:transcriptional regulator with XRE-family HTH domain